jgi:DNA-binding LacI/PurR family transcriptional regulator
VRVSPREMGRQGFAYAEALLSGIPAKPVLMPTTVVLRDSTATPPPTALGGHPHD